MTSRYSYLLSSNSYTIPRKVFDFTVVEQTWTFSNIFPKETGHHHQLRREGGQGVSKSPGPEKDRTMKVCCTYGMRLILMYEWLIKLHTFIGFVGI